MKSAHMSMSETLEPGNVTWLKHGGVEHPQRAYTCTSYMQTDTNRIIEHWSPTLCTKVIEGSLEVKLPTIWTDGKVEVGRVREDKGRRKKIREEKALEEVGRKVPKCPCFVPPEGREWAC